MSRGACVVAVAMAAVWPMVERSVASAEESAADEVGRWHDVTLHLQGALPNEHDRLADELEIYLGRSPQGQWREWVMGYSALFDEGNVGNKADRLYTWQDHEGVVVEAEESGSRVRLVVEMAIHDAPWVQGGTGRYEIELERKGNTLSGSFEGVYTKSEDPPRQQRMRDGRRVNATEDGPTGDRPAGGAVTGTIRDEPWPVRVDDVEPFEPGEHPRLLFRSGDVEHIRQRARTPQGQAIVERLQRMLQEDESLWHAYGYGMMYQLTGEQMWAERAAANVEAAIADEIDGGRYGWYTLDGGYMRAGPSIAAAAFAYDLCYDAWDEQFRQRIARRIQDRIWPDLVLEYDLRQSGGQMSPRSNHYMLWNGGAGLAILAIMGDPGTDDAITHRAHRIFQQRLKRGLEVGFGDHGWFWEGTYCGRFPTNGALLQYLQALQVAQGKDYVSNSSPARWLTTKWLYEVLRNDGRLDTHMRGMYARNFGRGGAVDGGDFAQGFGVLPEEHKPAVLWFYNRIIEPQGQSTYDALTPKHAVYALVNWPFDGEERDPAEVLGHVLHDEQAGFYAFRSGWEGEGDIVVSTWGTSVVMGRGLKVRFDRGMPIAARPDHFEQVGGKAFSISTSLERTHSRVEGWTAFSVDFSGLAGGPALVAGVTVTGRQAQRNEPPEAVARLMRQRGQERNREQPQTRRVEASDHAAAYLTSAAAGEVDFHILTITDGEAPQVRLAEIDGEQVVVVGRRTLRFDGEKIDLGEIEPAGE